MKERKTLKQLFIPIFLEVIFFMLVGSVDTLMLSAIGDAKVGAVGNSNTYLNLFTIAFSVISNGMLAVMTQYIGAKKEGVARKTLYLGIIFNGAIGLILSIVMIFWARPILSLCGVASNLLDDAALYMQIVGGTSFLTALTPIFTAYLRAFGHTKGPLIANVIANLVNIGLNAVFIYACHMDVLGVAIATVICRIVGILILIALCIIYVKIPKNAETVPTKVVILDVLKIGLPAALETAIYNLAMALVMTFLNRMDESGIYATVRTYACQLTNFSYSAGTALASANAIMVGWRIGEGRFEECRKETFKVAIIGVGISVATALVIALIGSFAMQIFTDDEEIIRLVQIVLFVDIALEIGRTSNLVFGQALKTSGDALFTVAIGAIFMYVCAVGGTYLFGNVLKWYVIGAWVGLSLDELMRALLMFLRWKSNKWQTKILVKPENKQ